MALDYNEMGKKLEENFKQDLKNSNAKSKALKGKK
jgi:hypothetical protein